MARKKKIVINNQELTPTVLATIENKKTGLIGLILLFIIFGGVVYYLPEISVYIENYLHPASTGNTPTNPSTPTNPGKDDADVVTIEKHPLSEVLSFTEKDLTLSNFSITDNALNFRITNSAATLFDLETKNYYIELYNEEDTLLERIKVDEISIGANSYLDVQLPISSASASKVSFLEILVEDYPSYTVVANPQGYGTMVCRKANEVVTYSFRKNLVYSIEDTFTISSMDPEFASILPTYQALATTYSTVSGVQSSISTQGTDTIFRTVVDLKTINESVFINKMVYPNNTDAKVIRFELAARGYTCE